MGGGGAHGGTTYKGYTIPHNKRWHTVAGKGLCAVMWFWVFYRAKQDGAVLLGLRHPWDGHDDHSHGHGHGHGHGHEASSSSSSSH
ncbi:NADH dehydrogenase [ubiquinone] 1 beta subcomplex subunit 2-like isoform X2 [Panicum virgatum]|uniref:NADH dehydrogenase [ubiquinone] 1 beta subcomplex subunit 2-like isoform X2 n=1 Tax=Panicum virgatum TaxID=38727 RepID=UPI0019D54F70|nr:NADH dehydrogenase [ubiquinone] 1 beta subcomplex subunit 2-like isoform X2 [Panicum virgatum]